MTTSVISPLKSAEESRTFEPLREVLATILLSIGSQVATAAISGSSNTA